MTARFTLTTNPGMVLRDDGWVIPIGAAGNVESDDYAAWRAAGNAPAPAPAVPPSVPASVTNYQARAALIQAGMFARADAALRAADQTVAANQIGLQAWDYANIFERGSPIIAAMAGVLGLAPADVDALFIAAAAVH